MLSPNPQLLLEHQDRVYRLALRLSVGCVAEAEDITQETLLAALKTFPLFLGQAKLTTWLYTITVRTWRARQRRKSVETVTLDGQDQAAPSDNAALRLDLSRALSALPENQREAFVLVKAEGWTHKEAAKILGVPQGTVQARVFEATRRLRELLTEETIPPFLPPPAAETATPSSFAKGVAQAPKPFAKPEGDEPKRVGRQKRNEPITEETIK